MTLCKQMKVLTEEELDSIHVKFIVAPNTDDPNSCTCEHCERRAQPRGIHEGYGMGGFYRHRGDGAASEQHRDGGHMAVIQSDVDHLVIIESVACLDGVVEHNRINNIHMTLIVAANNNVPNSLTCRISV